MTGNTESLIIVLFSFFLFLLKAYIVDTRNAGLGKSHMKCCGGGGGGGLPWFNQLDVLSVWGLKQGFA